MYHISKLILSIQGQRRHTLLTVYGISDHCTIIHNFLFEWLFILICNKFVNISKKIRCHEHFKTYSKKIHWISHYRANQQKFDLAMSQAAAEKQQALRELQYEKDIEKAKAVQDAEERERRLGKIRLDSLAKQSDDFAKELKTEIEKNKNEIDRLNEIIRNKEQNIENLEMCLFDTRKDFQDFIDNLPPFHKNQAEFMMPMVYLDELEKKGYVIQHLRPPMSKKSKKKKK